MEIPIFVVISGSDLYSIPEPSDVDIREFISYLR